MTQLEFPSGIESMAACTDLKSPFPLISTLIVRLVPTFCVNIGESMTVFTSKARAQNGTKTKIKMRIFIVNVGKERDKQDDEEEAMFWRLIENLWLIRF